MNVQILGKFKALAVLVAICILPMQIQAVGYSANYAACMNSAGIATSAVASCMNAEYRYQHKRAQDNFKASLALYGDAEKKSQKAANKQWKKLRATNCRKETSSDSIERKTYFLNCAIKMTVTRADLLEKQLYRLK